MSAKRNPAIVFIFITILIDVLGIGIIIPVLPKLLQELTGKGLSEASQYSGIMMAAYACMQFIFSPILGGLSDKYGRRPIILGSLFGFGLDYILLGFAPTIAWLFVGRIIAGITGASFTTASAYIADISNDENRSKNFGMIGAAFGVGFIIGPVIGGVLGDIGVRVPFFVAAALTLLNWLYGYFVLPESLKVENRRDFDWKRANPIGSLKSLGRYPVVLGLVGAFFCLQLAGQTHPSTWSYFTMKEFNWTLAEVGYSLSFVGLVVAIVQGGLNRIINPKLGDRNSVMVGLLFYAAGFALFALATKSWMMYAFMIPFGLGGIAGPALQSMISKQVPANEQGELQGGLTSLQSVTTIFGPLLASNLFAYFSAENAPVFFPGAAFMMAAVLTIIALLIALKSFPRKSVAEA
ncbi:MULTISPECIES: TCR/Tet family MFS transporter [unclassified Arcicella]|uniref:TCR/Tet family MFS transporter n=1 Tax=unclassified Arcicella TaxID=2644986 RepID=UPI002866645D|nr:MULTISPECIES: TCR/Tet family MFS transporter [unclassified Arcicella]MDR6559912.1 DHA1 family tetracycline resistance protein-like MFS transporter [Arcicella sp. BE51]MDR6810481.1 DHA1 family tetracycline resistance protein-like MFS transporter [Arcicella sp. BE140]MDR6821831.1 DHA1 family tetracycline resistance protein-like MFS transporter [Arcicella sp. BE139]